MGLKCNLWNCECEEYIHVVCGVSHIPAVMQIACFLVFPFFHVVWCLWDEFCILCAKLAMCEFLFLQACDSGWWQLGLLC